MRISSSGLKTPAAMAAWPMMMAPTIAIAEPIFVGTLSSDSRMSSMMNSSSNAPSSALKGTLVLASASAMMKPAGSVSLWKDTMATQ